MTVSNLKWKVIEGIQPNKIPYDIITNEGIELSGCWLNAGTFHSSHANYPIPIEQVLLYRPTPPSVAQRPQINRLHIKQLLDRLDFEYRAELDRKGDGIYISVHEVLGSILEEFLELVEAVHTYEPIQIDEELVDIIIACMHGLLSMKTAEMHW